MMKWISLIGYMSTSWSNKKL